MDILIGMMLVILVVFIGINVSYGLGWLIVKAWKYFVL